MQQAHYTAEFKSGQFSADKEYTQNTYTGMLQWTTSAVDMTVVHPK